MSLAAVIWFLNREVEASGKVKILASAAELAESSILVGGVPHELSADGEGFLVLPAGNHWLTIERTGFKPVERIVRVEANGQTDFRPVWRKAIPQASLVIEWPLEERVGAHLLIDGRRHGLEMASPVRIELEPGRHRVEIFRDRRIMGGETIDLSAGATFVYRPVVREAAPSGAPSEPPPAAAVANAAGSGQPPQPAGAGSASLFSGWRQSLDEARATAQREGKHLLILFDGSDWCGWSRALHRAVIAQPEFVPRIAGDYVLVHIDFPRHERARGEVEDADRNDRLASYYGVDGFPTIVLADGDGQPYETLGFDPEAGIGGFFRQIAAAREVASQIRTRCENVESAIRDGRRDARGLLRVALPEELVGHYRATVDRWYEAACQSDPSNRLGIREAVFDVRRAALLLSREKPFDARLEDVRQMLDSFLRDATFTSPVEASRQYGVLHEIWATCDARKAVDAAQEALRRLPEDVDPEVRRRLQNAADGVLSTGSGFAVTADGLVVTNAHVVGFASRVWLTIGDRIDTPLDAEVLARDAKLDLAVLRIAGDRKPRLAPLAIQTDPAERAEETSILGYPLGTDGVTHYLARISELPANRPDHRLIFDATVNQGNSGGPLVSRSGQVVGVVFAKTENTAIEDSVGLAVPAADLIRFLETNLSAADFRSIRRKPARNPADWQEVVRRAVPSIVRIVNRRLLLSAEEVQARNSRAWQVVLHPNRTESEYQTALQDSMEACQAIPSSDNLNTLGAALLRCHRPDEALKQLMTAAQMNEEQHGSILPSDAGLVALALHRLGKAGNAAPFVRKFEALMARPEFADNPDLQQLANELFAAFDVPVVGQSPTDGAGK